MPKQSGFTLFEVMVSLFLLSAALLGIFTVAATSLRKSRELDLYQQASRYSQNMAVYLRVHHGDSSVYLDEWSSQIQSALVNGRGEVTGSYPDYQIKITWGDSRQNCEESRLGNAGCIMRNIKI
jgi:prepilin-type N-terminal cleavage/methylation domain-containing protein